MTYNNCDLSIIIPVYNVESYLEQCISSILEQDLDMERFEIIIINDGSTDNSWSICQKLAKEHRNINAVSQKNGGQSVARNNGMNLAKGKYLYFMDSDDFLSPHFFDNILDLALQNDLDFIGFGSRRTSERPCNIDKEKKPLAQEKKYNGLEFISFNNFNNGPWWYFIKKSIVKDHRFVEGRFCEDGLFTAEILLKIQSGAMVSDIVYNYFENPDSTVMNFDSTKNNKMIDDMLFANHYYNRIIEKMDHNSIYYTEAFQRLRERQESYLFFAFTRMLKRKSKYQDFNDAIKFANTGKYQSYPMRNFTGYDKKEKFLRHIFNEKFLLYFVVNVNRLL